MPSKLEIALLEVGTEHGRDTCDLFFTFPVLEEIKEVIASEVQPVEISDLHVWRVGRTNTLAWSPWYRARRLVRSITAKR